MSKSATEFAANVAIIGGGFTGASVAFQIARLSPRASIVIFEPRPSLGRGLAYDDPDPSRRTNVPAAKMSLIPGDSAHFARWIAKHDAVSGDPHCAAGSDQLYPHRAVFGRYVSEHLAPLLARGSVRHVRGCVTAVTRDDDAWVVTMDHGGTWRADVTVLATTHPKPKSPDALSAIGSDPRLVTDPLDVNALDGMPPEARVLIIGTGLTMGDVVASLDRQGHRGNITAISRRGLRSRGQSRTSSDPYGSFVSATPQTSSELVRTIRNAVRAASNADVSWHAVFDALRRDAQAIWTSLNVDEQRRIVRHLRVFWDVHRFRLAPQVEAVLNRRLKNGTLDVVAASIRSFSASPESLNFQLVRRRSTLIEQLSVDRAVVCTGPAHGRIVESLPYLRALSRQGLIASDPLRLGLACDRVSRALDNEGASVRTLFIAGPLARATFGELMGVPEIAVQALRVAEAVSEIVAARPDARFA